MESHNYNATEILPNVWLGNIDAAYDQRFHNKYNIQYILSIIDEFDDSKMNNRITYIRIPIKDDQTCHMNLVKLYDFTSNVIKDAISNKKPILIHCKRGHHRSASTVAAFLIKFLKISDQQAIKYIRHLRPMALRRDNCCMKSQLHNYYLLSLN